MRRAQRDVTISRAVTSTADAFAVLRSSPRSSPRSNRASRMVHEERARSARHAERGAASSGVNIIVDSSSGGTRVSTYAIDASGGLCRRIAPSVRLCELLRAALVDVAAALVDDALDRWLHAVCDAAQRGVEDASPESGAATLPAAPTASHCALFVGGLSSAIDAGTISRSDVGEFERRAVDVFRAAGYASVALHCPLSAEGQVLFESIAHHGTTISADDEAALSTIPASK